MMKKSIFKKALTLVMALAMTLGCLQTTAFASVTKENLDSQAESVMSKVSYIGDENVKGTAYISISDDDWFVTSNGDKAGVLMNHVAVPLSEVAKISLDDYDLKDYIFDLSEYEPSAEGKEPLTLLHVFLYVLDNYYKDGATDLTVTGGQGSAYMENGFWGHSENLTYYVNGKYPLAAEKFGATLDQIIIEDGDFIDVAMFTDYDFLWNPDAGYLRFADSEKNIVFDYAAEAGEELLLNLVHPHTDFSGDYITENLTASGVTVEYGKVPGTALGSVVTDSNGAAKVKFENGGTYYVWAYGLKDGESTVTSPAMAKVSVAEKKVYTASVDITSQMGGAFLHAPAFDLEVSSELSDIYGYTDSVTDGVSVLDALIAAHEMVFGDDFTAETATEYLKMSANSPTKQFGIDSSDCYGGFFLNHALANDGTKYDANNYNGTLVGTQKIVSGDLVEFFFFEDENWGDTYNWFTDAKGVYSREFDAVAGKDIDLVLRGFYAMSASACKDEAELVAFDGAYDVDAAMLYLVDLESGALTEIEGAITDEGDVTLKFDQPGTYTIAAYGTEDTTFTQLLTLTTVNVTSPTPEDGFSGQLYTAAINIAPAGADASFYLGADADKSGRLTGAIKDNGIVGKYHQYEITAPAGIYSYRAAEGETDLGGMSFTLPLKDSNDSVQIVNEMTLVRVNYYTTNANITEVGDYTLEIFSSDGEVLLGEQYIDTTITSGKAYVVTPVMLRANGNGTLYNRFFTINKESIKDTYGIAPVGNETYAATLSATQRKTFSLSTLQSCSVVAQKEAEINFFQQLNNYNVIDITQKAEASDNGDGTVTYTITAPSLSNVTFRANMQGKRTQAGYCVNKAVFNIDFSEKTYQSSTTIGGAYENSLLLNINEKNKLEMNAGETYRLRALRNTQITNNATANIMIEPEFHYEILSGSDVVSLSPVTERCTGNAKNNWMDVTAVKNGTAVVSVYYDAVDVYTATISTSTGQTTKYYSYGDTDAECVETFVITVGSKSDITITPLSNDGDWDAEFDTVYYYGENGTFAFTAEGLSDVTVQNTKGGCFKEAVSVVSNEGKYSVPVTEGYNIITLKKGAEEDFRLVRAKKIVCTITNNTTGQSSVYPADIKITQGDEITVSFDSLNMPVPKLSGIYNPGYGGTNKTSMLLNGKYAISSSGVQYNYASPAQSALTFTAYIAGENTLTLGCTKFTSMGDPFGGHRLLTDNGRSANFTASAVSGIVSTIEDISFNVTKGTATPNYDNLVGLKSINIYNGTSAYVKSFGFTNATMVNNAANWGKATSAMTNYAFVATVTAKDYYNTIELRYWYDGDEDVTKVMLESGIEFKVPAEDFDADGDRIFNIQVVVTPSEPQLGPAKVYSYMVYPGASSLSYVHPAITSLDATDADGNVYAMTDAEGNAPVYTKTDYVINVEKAKTLTLTAKMLQKYTNATNMKQDKNDTVLITKKNGNNTVGQTITAAEGGSYPTGTWTLENLDITDCDRLEIIVSSYVNDTCRTYNVDLVKSLSNDAGVCGQKASWTLENGTLTISGEGAMRSYGRRSDVPWYGYIDEIREVVVEEGVSLIGNYAFAGCTELEKITLADSIRSIGTAAFTGCRSLKEITLPENLEKIGNYAFNNCSALELVIFAGKGLPEMAANSFNGVCARAKQASETYWINRIGLVGLCKYTLSFGTLTISGNGAMRSFGKKTDLPWYEYRNEIKKVVVSEGVTLIGNYAFAECENLKDVSLSSTVKTVGVCAFSRNTALLDIDLSNVGKIGKYAFNNCSSLKNAILSENVEADATAFNGTGIKN